MPKHKRRKRNLRISSEEIALITVILVVTIFFAYSENFAKTGYAVTKDSGLPDWAASWAGVPWDVESGETLVSADFSDSKAVVSAKSQYIYRWGYRWDPSKVNDDGSIGGWQLFEFPQTSQYDGWAQSSASAEIPLGGDEILDGENYVLAYTCNWKNGKWYCGCLNAETGADGALLSCGRWQLQTFDAYTATGVAQDMSKVLSPDTPAAEKQAAQTRLNEKKTKGGLALTVVSDVKGDFNSDGKVDLDDFFLFANVYGLKAGEERDLAGQKIRYDAKYDLDGNGIIDFEDFFIFADNFGKRVERKFNVGENCKEVFSGFNGPPNERVNLVFMSFNYESVDKFLDKVKSTANINDDYNPFFSYEPIKSNKNKFNLWFVNKISQTSYKPTYTYNPPPEDFDKFVLEFKNLASECKIISSKANYFVVVLNNKFRSYAFPYDDSEGAVILSDDIESHTFFHEFMHAFGKYYDEYDFDSALIDNPGAVNCDIANTDAACPKWCKGAPVSVEEFKKVNCSKFDYYDCINEAVKGSPCFPINGNGQLGKDRSCINLINFCTSIKDEATCRDTTNNFYLNPVCSWIKDSEHPYYKSQCIPQGNNINIGTQCLEGTGCYNGCTFRGIFRSEKRGLFKESAPDLPFGIYNEKILCEKLKQVTGSAGGICTEKFGIN